MPAIVAGVIFVFCWVYAVSGRAHTPKSKSTVVKEIK